MSTEWDAFVLGHPHGHLLQLSGWGQLKAAFGWCARVIHSETTPIQWGALVLTRALPFKMGTMAYIPMGPLLPADAPAAAFRALIDRIARELRPAFVKIEPGFNAAFTDQLVPAEAALRPSPQTIQPPRTVLLDLRDGQDALLARMNQGTRRKIRTGPKKGVTVRAAALPDLAAFSALMQTTGTRNAFGVHSAEYYAMAYERFVPDHGTLLLAEHADDLLAGVFVFAVGSSAYYLYGASSDLKRSLMGSYAAQWAGVQWAIQRGCATYDMWGVPDADEAVLEGAFQERSEGLWGVYGFKRGWGGAVMRTAGAWDLPLNPVIYRAYRLALWARSGALSG